MHPRLPMRRKKARACERQSTCAIPVREGGKKGGSSLCARDPDAMPSLTVAPLLYTTYISRYVHESFDLERFPLEADELSSTIRCTLACIYICVCGRRLTALLQKYEPFPPHIPFSVVDGRCVCTSKRGSTIAHMHHNSYTCYRLPWGRRTTCIHNQPVTPIAAGPLPNTHSHPPGERGKDAGVVLPNAWSPPVEVGRLGPVLV